MSNLLYGCCLIPSKDEILLTPSFSEYSPCILNSSMNSDSRCSSSKSKSRLQRCDTTKILYTKSCAPGPCYASSEIELHNDRRDVNFTSDPLLLPEEDAMSVHGVPTYRSTDSSYDFAYGSKPPPKITYKNRILDIISMCLWKCSIGCQQLPNINM